MLVLAILTLVFAQTSSAQTASEQQAASHATPSSSWQIEARLLRPPAAASDILRNSIANAPQPNVVNRSLAPKNKTEWEAVIAQRTVERKVDIAQLEKRANVSIKRDEIGGVGVYYVVPNSLAAAHKSHLFIHLHGGAYVFGGGDASVAEAAIIAGFSGMRAMAIDYRMPPTHPFPAALDDVVAVYKKLLETYKSSAIAIGGTSAGAGLSLAAVHQFKTLELPVPGAVYAGTPWADLTKTGDSLYTNEGIDRILVTYDGAIGAAALLYANGQDLKNPLLSPVYGEFADFPPTYLVTGTRDMFLSDTARTHRKLRRAGVVAELNVYEGLSHAGYLVAVGSTEQKQVYSELAEFLTKHLD
ncbi:MAG: alpha/beta hydrolase [Pseudomonadales bacterium]